MLHFVIELTYSIIEFAASLFYGFKAAEIFTDVPKKPKDEQRRARLKLTLPMGEMVCNF